MDSRFLFFGIIANIAVVFSTLGGFAVGDVLIFALRVTALIATGILTTVGLLRQGRMSSDATGGILIGNLPVLTFGSFLAYSSYVAYLESLPFCQDYAAGDGSALVRCQQAQGFLYLVDLFATSIIIASIVGIVSLVHLRELSKSE